MGCWQDEHSFTKPMKNPHIKPQFQGHKPPINSILNCITNSKCLGLYHKEAKRKRNVWRTWNCSPATMFLHCTSCIGEITLFSPSLVSLNQQYPWHQSAPLSQIFVGSWCTTCLHMYLPSQPRSSRVPVPGSYDVCQGLPWEKPFLVELPYGMLSQGSLTWCLLVKGK